MMTMKLLIIGGSDAGMLLGAGWSDGQALALLTITKPVANGTPVH